MLIWIVFFVCLNRIVGTVQGDGIKNMDDNISEYINMFRNSIGDLQQPFLQSNEDCTGDACKNNLPVLFTWAVFVINVYFMAIILTNFLIARVSATYEDFISSFTLTVQQNQSHLINEYLQFVDFFSGLNLCKVEDYSLIIMFLKMESGGESGEGVVKTLRKLINTQFGDLKTKLHAQVSKVVT